MPGFICGGSMTARGGRLWGVLVLAGLCIAPVWTQESAGRAPAADLSVPAHLKPLLAAPQSEMRLVTLLYNTDRNTLNGDYDTGRFTARSSRGGGGGGGREGAAAGREGVAGRQNAGRAGGGREEAGRGSAEFSQGAGLSTARIARLKRYEMDWQTALARIDASQLSPGATSDLRSLQSTVQANLQQLDADAAAIAEVMPLLPFATP